MYNKIIETGLTRMNIIFYAEGKYLSWKSQKSSYLQFIRLYMLCALSELFITILWTSSAQQLPIAAYLQMDLFHLLLWQVYLLLSWKKSVKQNKNKLQNWQLFIPFNATAARSILPLLPLFSRKLFSGTKNLTACMVRFLMIYQISLIRLTQVITFS